MICLINETSVILIMSSILLSLVKEFLRIDTINWCEEYVSMYREGNSIRESDVTATNHDSRNLLLIFSYFLSAIEVEGIEVTFEEHLSAFSHVTSIYLLLHWQRQTRDRKYYKSRNKSSAKSYMSIKNHCRIAYKKHSLQFSKYSLIRFMQMTWRTYHGDFRSSIKKQGRGKGFSRYPAFLLHLYEFRFSTNVASISECKCFELRAFFAILQLFFCIC